MCTVSMIGDFYDDKWKKTVPADTTGIWSTPPTRQEFEELKKEVLDMKELLKRAKKYDNDNGEPNCEIEDKMEFLRKVAQMVGIDLDDILGEK